MNLIAGILLALAASEPPVAEPLVLEPQIALQLSCAAAQELRLPSTCSEIRLRVIVAMGRPQWV